MSDAPQEETPPETGAGGAAAEEAGPPPAPPPEELETLRVEAAALRREASDAKDLARRAQADLANVRRRSRDERAGFRSRALEEVSVGLLPVLDDLHRAVHEIGRATKGLGEDGGSGDAGAVINGLGDGVRLVLRRFEDALNRQGLSEIAARGSRFDPHLHDAVQEIPAAPGQRDGEVVEVLSRGYQLDGRVIRPATVIVASAPPAATDAAGKETPGKQEPDSEPEATGTPVDEPGTGQEASAPDPPPEASAN